MNESDHAAQRQDPGGRTTLLAVAAMIELEAIARGLGIAPPTPGQEWSVITLAPGLEAVLTGIGKANAAGAVARVLDPARHTGVISLGIGGSLPDGPPLGSLVLGASSVFADEGVVAPDGFRACRSMGFPLLRGETDAILPDPSWLEAWRDRVDLVAPIATVSTCSGTDALASEVASRTGASVEAMEGAAAGLAVRAIDPTLAFAELRVVSNTTGDRPDQRWDLKLALSELGKVLGRVALSTAPGQA